MLWPKEKLKNYYILKNNDWSGESDFLSEDELFEPVFKILRVYNISPSLSVVLYLLSNIVKQGFISNII